MLKSVQTDTRPVHETKGAVYVACCGVLPVSGATLILCAAPAVTGNQVTARSVDPASRQTEFRH